MDSPPSISNDLTARLRERIRRIERPTAIARGVLPFGIAAVDRSLPGGGLARGVLHEIIGVAGDEEDGALAAAFAAAILARLTASAVGAVLWCLARPDLYGPGLAAHGLDPSRLVLVRAARDADILWAMEEGLRTPGVVAAVGEIGGLPDVAGRRLQLAAERSGITAFVLRRWRNAAEAARERALPSAAATRWRIAALPSGSIPVSSTISVPDSIARHRRAGEDPGKAHLAFPVLGPSFRGDYRNKRELGVGYPRWRIELLRCRGGEPAAWTVDLHQERIVNATDPVSLAAALADRPAPLAATARSSPRSSTG